MPQMMPINWLFSFVFFVCIYLIFNIMNYYIFNMKISKNNKNINIKLKNLTWKW
uniref:ATP synthase F0 subunit 8 n=1 Tax=Chrysodeixis acuta TaxID=925779 RepID=UPI002181F51B|nr:ATP synthase F0 subunit 8 [Chrysodeixis acuta]UVI59363.1 ATP synthetase F0 subunit 8 [Chrysodeixis acuta]